MHNPERDLLAGARDMARKTNHWTREQVLVALNLYTQLPFGQLDENTPLIREVAPLLGRSPGALAMKLTNLASLDPDITASGRVGLKGCSKLDEQVWAAFTTDRENTVQESQALMDALVKETPLASLSSEAELDTPPVATEDQTTGTSQLKIRRGQAFFRRAVLASYRSRCCMSGLQTPRLLVASHIKPWNKDVGNRLNPHNGLCLSALHDRAYDLGFISVRPDYTIAISADLEQDGSEFTSGVLCGLKGAAIDLPGKFRPDKTFLEWHYAEVFRG